MPLAEVPREGAVTKRQFHASLRTWLEATTDARIGPEEIRGQTAWVHVRDGSTMFALNADTKRESVAEYLKLVEAHGDDIAWEITASQRGNMTAVVYGPTKVRLKPFYLYVSGSST
jgi:hypothetical protein